jgi:hypothetical protein
MRGIRGGFPAFGVLLLLGSLLLHACGGTGNRLDTDGDGPGGGQYLPVVQQVDSGIISLEVAEGEGFIDGRLSLGGQDLVLADPFSGTAVRLVDESNVSTAEDVYDYEGNGVPNYIVVTIRALSAQAAANVTAFDADDNQLNPADFIKVGGAAFLPLDATFSAGVEITLPVSPNSNPEPGKLYDLYRWVDNTIDGRQTAADVGTGTGYWQYLQDVEVGGTGINISFTVNELGQYCVATDEVTHSQGEGETIS